MGKGGGWVVPTRGRLSCEEELKRMTGVAIYIAGTLGGVGVGVHFTSRRGEVQGWVGCGGGRMPIVPTLLSPPLDRELGGATSKELGLVTDSKTRTAILTSKFNPNSHPNPAPSAAAPQVGDRGAPRLAASAGPGGDASLSDARSLEPTGPGGRSVAGRNCSVPCSNRAREVVTRRRHPIQIETSDTDSLSVNLNFETGVRLGSKYHGGPQLSGHD
eukprot:749461-Hanusia_phi.AAC.2